MSATQPAPATRQADAGAEAELKAALERVIPAEVRKGRRQPTDREKMAQRFVLMLAVSDNGLNEEQAKENHKKRVETQKAVDEVFKRLRAENEHAPEEVRDELAEVERLTGEQTHLLDFLDRPTTFPSTRASEADLARRVSQIPQVLDRSAELDRDLSYHDKRLELLREMETLKAKAGGTGDAARVAREKLEADAALLAATDAAYKAQVRADRIKVESPTTAP